MVSPFSLLKSDDLLLVRLPTIVTTPTLSAFPGDHLSSFLVNSAKLHI